MILNAYFVKKNVLEEKMCHSRKLITWNHECISCHNMLKGHHFIFIGIFPQAVIFTPQ